MPDLVELTRVCRRWREIALGLSMLWTSINDSSRNPDDILKRSGVASLKVCVKGALKPGTAEFLRIEGARIQELYLLNANVVFGLGNELKPYVKFSPERLEHLTLATDGDRRDYGVSPVLFTRSAPKLKSLTMQSLTWLPRNQFSSLTHLCIYDRRRQGPNYESFMTAYQLSDFLSFLSGCPKLEDLTLVDIWIDSRRDNEDLLPVISLSHLRRLALGKMIPRLVLFLLSHIKNPPGVATRIFGMTCSDREFLPKLSTLVPVLGMKKLHLSVGSGKSFVFSPSSSSQAARIEFHQCVGGCAHCQEWASLLWAKWPLTSVRELWMTDRVYLSRLQSHERLVRQLPNLTSLTICQHEKDASRRSHFANELHRLIVTLTTPRGAPADSLLFCPHLAVVRLWFCGLPIEVTSVVKFVAARAQLGYPVQQLVIECAEARPLDASFDVVLTELKLHVNQVEFRTSSRPPTRELPTACNVDTHEFWPAW